MSDYSKQESENIFLRLSDFFIKQPLIKWVALTFLLLVAASLIPKLQRYSLPRVDLKEVVLTTVYAGASPEEIETEVTHPIEEEIDSVNGIEKYSSTSAENLSTIHIYIDKNIKDVEKVKTDLRSAIDRAELPNDAEDPIFSEIKIDNIPILEIGFTSERLSPLQLSEQVRDLRKKILRLPKVARVEEEGVPEKEMHVLLDKDKLIKRKISILEVVDAIDQAKKKLFSGGLSKSSQQLNIITTSIFETPDQVEDLIVRATGLEDQGVVIRVKDIAKVEWGIKEQTKLYHYNGIEGMGLRVVKKSEADVINAVDEVVAFIDGSKSELEKMGIEIHYHSDDAFDTRNKLSIVYQNMFIGLFLILAILALFLSKVIALWTALAVPVVMLIGLGLASFFGVSINAISLCGVIVATGILVDDAIVVGESIFYHRQNGYSPFESSMIGLRKVVQPVFFSVLTTVVGFMSITFVEGDIGDFSIEIPIMVSLILFGSLVEAFFFLPSNLAHVGLHTSVPPGEKFLDVLSLFYKKTLRMMLRRPFISLGIAGLFLVLGGFLALSVSRFNLFPDEQAFFMQFNGEFEGGDTLQYSDDQIKKIEEILQSLPPGVVRSYKTKVGGLFKNEWEIDVLLTPYYERELKAIDVKNYFFEEIEKNKEELNISLIDYRIDDGGPPSGKPIEIIVVSDNDQKREDIFKEIKNDFKDLGLYDIYSNLRETREELTVHPKESAYFVGLFPEKVAVVLRAAFEGVVAEKINIEDEKIDLRVKLDRDTINFDDPLKDIMFLNFLGQYIPVKNFVDLRSENSHLVINHRDGVKENTITARFDQSKITALQIYKLMQEKYQAIDEANRDLEIIIGGKAEKSSSTFISLLIAVAISIFGIYVLLVFQFRSLSQPFIVSLAIPFGIVGLLLMLSVQGYTVSVIAMIGIIGFGGVVVNASIVMIDFINRLLNDRAKELVDNGEKHRLDENGESAFLHEDYENAIVEGAVLRLRPIFITTFTTLGGLAPTAYGFIGNTDQTIAPIAMAMMWGLIFGTSAGLYVTPLFYLINERVVSFFSRLFGRLKRKAS